MSKPPKHDPLWAKAKQVCRLNLEDIAMAKALGMKPKSLMKNQPSPPATLETAGEVLDSRVV